MLFGIYRLSLQCFAAITRLGLIPLFLIGLTPATNAAEINALTIESAPGQPFLAQLPIQNAHPDTDLSCFTLQQPGTTEQIQLEYTTLGSLQGMLMLWSNSAISTPLTLTLTDNCKRTSQTFTIQANNIVTTSIPNTATQVLPVEKPATPQPDLVAEPTELAPAISADAYNALQQQINILQVDFKELQKKSDALYASNITQVGILASLKNQLTQLQNENHLLRTLVLTLSLALIASGYFFADWLRRNAAFPKVAKSRDKAKEKNVKNTLAATTPSPESGLADRPAGGNQAMPHPQSPQQTTYPANRLQSVPQHANDDQVSPTGFPQKISSQQSTNAVMQDASRLFTHGRVNQAIEHLQQYLANHPKCSPWMWLYLLDLLSKEGKQQEFDVVAGECRKHFNLSVERNPDFKQQGIESYPRIMKALQQTWGTPQVIALIDDLVYNTRLVPRMGFERSIFEEMMLLKEIACQTQNLPTTPPAENNVINKESASDNLRELQKLSGDIYVLAPVDQTPFQYWTDFTFELDEPSTLRKSA